MGIIKLYGHAGSGNHGCEALVRTTAGLINVPMELYSNSPDQDQKYGVDQIVTIYDDRPIPVKRNSFQYLLAAIDAKLRHSEKLFTEFSHPSFFKRIQKDDICLSIGGDTYCYGKGGRDILAHYNQVIHQKGAKSVLWGCSIDVDVLDDCARRDIAGYDLITVREERSYELLKEINSNTVKVCDSAFFLEPEILPWPNGFSGKDVVGINVSPLASAGGEAVMDNYLHLIKFILQKTGMQIALIPHVVTGGKDDMSSLNELYQYFEGNPRVVLLKNHNCMELKGYIARCRFFVGARTHATIAAYSSLVPTLVTGYSLKAIGIAEDLFGTWNHYVLPVQNMNSPDELTKAFQWLLKNEEEIHNYLEKVVPEYKQQIWAGVAALQKLIEE